MTEKERRVPRNEKPKPATGRNPVTELTAREQQTHDFLRLHDQYRRMQADLLNKRYRKKTDAV